MALTLRAACVSDLGLMRENNEDTAYAGRRLLAVADGVGGAPAGELASDIVIRTLAPLEDAPDVGDALAALRTALESANDQIREAAGANPAHEGMGTTMTAMLLAGDQLALLHVGDSRGYLFRDGGLRQLTKDETLVQALIDQGVLTPAQARSHPHRSMVIQAVQGQDLTPTGATLTLRPADRLLLCSDGLSDFIVDDAIAQTLRGCPDAPDCADQLVKLALQAGARDNVTVVVADVVAA
jgi:serine/threonine protein phosphatase PrpC